MNADCGWVHYSVQHVNAQRPTAHLKSAHPEVHVPENAPAQQKLTQPSSSLTPPSGKRAISQVQSVTQPAAKRSNAKVCALCNEKITERKTYLTRCCQRKMHFEAYTKWCCSEQHERYSVCYIHAGNKHSGHWKDCRECRIQSTPCDYEDWACSKSANHDPLDREQLPPTKKATCDKCDKQSEMWADVDTCATCTMIASLKAVDEANSASSSVAE